MIAPFVFLIHGVDSLKLLKEINKEAKKSNKVIDCLLQLYIAKEETKFGLNEEELKAIVEAISQTHSEEERSFKNITIKGLMGMASFTDDEQTVRNEFKFLKSIFEKYSSISTFNFQLSI